MLRFIGVALLQLTSSSLKEAMEGGYSSPMNKYYTQREYHIMSETENLLPKRSTRRNIVYATLVFCFLLIGYLVYAGSPDNSLHESGLAWAFSTSIFVIGGYVFGSVMDNLNDVKYKK